MKQNKMRNVAVGTVKKSTATISRRLVMADLVLVHRSLRRLVTKESEFRPDSWSSPERILVRHASNQLADLGIDLRSAGLPGS